MTVNGNQGLEALAALCGGQSEAPTETGDQSNSQDDAPAQMNRPHTAAQMQQMLQAAVQLPPGTGQQQSSLSGVTPQQWQQALAATIALQGGSLESVTRNLLASAVGSRVQTNQSSQQTPKIPQPQQSSQQNQPSTHQQHPRPGTRDGTALAAMQQLAYYQYMAAAQQAAGIGGTNNGSPVFDPAQALALALANKHTNNGHVKQEATALPPTVAGQGSSATVPQINGSLQGKPVSSPPPPPPPARTPINPGRTIRSPAATASKTPSLNTSIAPMPDESGARKQSQSLQAHDCGIYEGEDKKQQKRAANRRSAQLSRKRKKQFIEELKEENDELRRKEQILRSIPDLVVVFDSSGKIWFVSQSITRFLKMTPEELEGTSFWDRLCEDSVRLLKAAFMDSLAARKTDSETAPLGSGVWELRLVDKDHSQKIVTLNGVVHFSGEAPECVCCIRPRDGLSVTNLGKNQTTGASNTPSTPAVSSSSDGSQMSSGEGAHILPELSVKPNQSVMNSASSSSSSDQADTNGSGETDDGDNANGRKCRKKTSIRISDGDTGSGSDCSLS